jgi:PPE-repeat protein
MSFSVLPPEVTSAQMYGGAGAGPMLAAAAAWDGLGSELYSAAESFSSVTSGLAGGPWQGSAAAAMTAVAGQYKQWLSTAAAHAGGAASGAQAIAGIFEAAKSAITHPAAVLANRLQLVQLVRSNLFGFAAPAIAATEGAYEEMWAQNVASLTGYHSAASAVAAQMSPLAEAVQALPAALKSTTTLSGSLLSQVTANNQRNLTALERVNETQISGTQALATKDLQLAGAALTGQQAASPLARLQSAAGYVTAAADINVGTAVQVGGRSMAALPLALGQDLDIAGGAGPLNTAPLAARPVSEVVKYGGGGGVSLQQQLMDYNQAQLSSYQRLTGYELSTTQNLTSTYFSQAATAIGTGDVGTAASRVAAVASINVGTGLQVAARTADLLPMMLGGDLDIAGGGASLLSQQPAIATS